MSKGNQSNSLFFLVLTMVACLVASSCGGGSDKVRLSWNEVKPMRQGKFKVNIYVENSVA